LEEKIFQLIIARLDGGIVTFLECVGLIVRLLKYTSCRDKEYAW